MTIGVKVDFRKQQYHDAYCLSNTKMLGGSKWTWELPEKRR
jgi:hypothetical protein